MNAALRFASHAAGLRWHDLPQSAQHAAKIFLFDTLAVGAAGMRAARGRDPTPQTVVSLDMV